MRIAVISRTFSRSGGGAESYSVAIAQHLAQRHEVHVFAQQTNQPVAGVAYHPVICLGQKPRWLNQLVFAVATWIKTRRGFDVVHSHENTWHGQVQTIHVRPLRHNLLFPYRGVRLGLRWLKVLLSPRLLTYVLLEGARFTARPTRKIVATSENLRKECEQAYPHCATEISVITPGTELHENQLLRAAARQGLGLPLEGFLVLFVANDYARKGLDSLMTALTLMREQAGLVVVGNPRAAPRYRQMAQRLGLGERVHFLGSLDDLSPAYLAADCLAHPTQEDTFAMVVLEAMAHGLPVVVSGPVHCGISAQLTDGVEALLLSDPRDSESLATRIDSILSTPLLADNLRGHGLRFAQQHSWEKAALQYEALYMLAAIKQ